MEVDIQIGNHQEAVNLPEGWLSQLESLALPALRLAQAHAVSPHAPLHTLQEVDVALVDDPTSARVHEEFMAVPGPTDVITFHHGEIVIGVEVALRQAAEYGEPPGRELLRYLVHGLLHLAGHEDEAPGPLEQMNTAQEAIVAELWTNKVAATLGS